MTQAEVRTAAEGVCRAFEQFAGSVYAGVGDAEKREMTGDYAELRGKVNDLRRTLDSGFDPDLAPIDRFRAAAQALARAKLYGYPVVVRWFDTELPPLLVANVILDDDPSTKLVAGSIEHAISVVIVKLAHIVSVAPVGGSE